MAITQPDFSKIFASGAAVGEILTWPDSDYLRGWGYLSENEPPPMEFFNRLQNLSDQKASYLAQTLNVRYNNTSYAVGDVARTPNMSSKYVLQCTKAGVTATAEPTLTSVSDGSTVSDGGVTWTVRDPFNVDKLGGQPKSYYEGLFGSVSQIKKVTFANSSTLWTEHDGYQRIQIARNGLSCIAVFKVDGTTETQIFAGISQDANYVYIDSSSAFAGYFVGIQYTQ